MTTRNTLAEWGAVSKCFHWVMVLLIIAEVPAGFLMSYTYGLALKNPDVVPLQTLASQIHHTIGFSLLALAAGRLTWRLLQKQRPAPLGRFYVLSSWLVQPCLYALLFLLPLSGWSALSVYGLAPVWIFGWQGVVPPVLPKLPYDSPYGYVFFAHIHLYCLWAGAGLLTVHVAAALWHHFGRRDGLLVRMWPLGRQG